MSRRKTRVSIMLLIGVLLSGFAITGLVPGAFHAVQADAAYSRDPVSVPIIMYHSVLKDTSRSGAYVVTPQILEEDLLYLQDYGYETVFVKDLIDYVYQGTKLPPKPVVITFDDGFYNNLVYVLPILEKHDMKAVISVVGEYIRLHSSALKPNIAYGYVTWEDVRTLHNSGLVEIANHSFNLHSSSPRQGSSKMREETFDHYHSVFVEDVGGMQGLMWENLGTEAQVYTYPFGFLDEYSSGIVKEMGFLASLSCYERINVISNEADLYNLGRYNRPAGISTEEFMKTVVKLPELQ